MPLQPSMTHVEDDSRDHSYFIITPQLVWALCHSCYEFTLWCTIKMIAGEQGECILSTDDLAAAAMMSAGKCSDCRQTLLELGLVHGNVHKDPGYPQPVWHLTIPDIWQRNLRWRTQHHSLADRIRLKRQQKSLHHVKPSPGEGGTTPGEGGTTPGETKKNQKKNSKEERIWLLARDDLRLQMTRSSFDTWLASCRLSSLENGDGSNYRAVITCTNTYVRDWIQHRLCIPIHRTLSTLLEAETLEITYKAEKT